MSDRNSRAVRPGKKRKPGRYYKPNPLRTAMRFGFVVFLALFLVAGFLLGRHIYQDWKERQELEALQEMIDTSPTETEPSQDALEGQQTTDPQPGDTTEPDDGILRKYRALYQQNGDMYGWLSIADTQLSYPVMYTPEKPEYYLRRNFDKAYSTGGLPFLSADYYEGCGNTIIYGHNMRNGTMFRTLMSYKEEAFYREHPMISYDTIYEEGEYEIISVFYSRVFEVDERNVFRFYYYSDLTDQARFEEFVTNVKALSLYETDATASYGDELLTLITCGGEFEEQRFVVVARRISGS